MIRELQRIYESKTFDGAFEFMSQALEILVSSQDHHPSWENAYDRVGVWLSTFSLDRQVTNRDLKLAESLEDLWLELGKGE